MIKITTLIPIIENNGEKVPNEFFTWFEDQLLEIAGAFSNRPPVDGAWKGLDRTYRDISREYTIAVKTKKQAREIRKVVIDAGRRLQQEAMYFETVEDAKIEIIPVK
jgi:hypothetical protein